MNSKKLMIRLRSHPLINLLINSKGNPKILLLIEPLWGVPFNLISPFATLYMYSQGITDIQIGLILSISMVVQVIFSFFGGIITDKLGRKYTTVMGDMLGWGIACIIWTVSHNFWLFLAAVLLNSFEQINQTAWHCLMIEDAPEKDILNIYTCISIGGLISVFIAPVSGILIDRYSLVPVVRVLYLTFSITMLIKSFITYRYTKETKQGIIRRKQTKAVPVQQMLAEYKRLIPNILNNKSTVRMLIISVMLYITNMINGNFFSLYVNIRLGVAERYLAIFPILRAAVMLVFMFALQHKFERMRMKNAMLLGLTIYVFCQALLIFSPEGKILPLALYIFCEAVAHALVIPRKDAMLALNIDPAERARIMSVMVAFMIAFTSPFGYLAGFLSSIDRRLPFIFSTALFMLAIITVSKFNEPAPETSVKE